MSAFDHNHLLTLADFSQDDYRTVFNTTAQLRRQHREGSPDRPLDRKVLAMLFEKRSTRTRASFFGAMAQLGGQIAEFSENVLHVGEGHESVEDTARAIGLYADGIVMRCFEQKKVEDYAAYSGIPIINGLTDDLHPCQILADLFSLYELNGELEGFRMAYVGRPNNIINTLVQGCATLDVELAIAYPRELPLGVDRLQAFTDAARKSNGSGRVKIDVFHDPAQALAGARAVYTDTWFNTGEVFDEAGREKLIATMKPFQVNAKLMKQAEPGAYFMHCLPAERGFEVTDEVIDDEAVSIVWRQAENRLHVQKAVLALLMGR